MGTTKVEVANVLTEFLQERTNGASWPSGPVSIEPERVDGVEELGLVLWSTTVPVSVLVRVHSFTLSAV